MDPASSHRIQGVGVRPARPWHQLCPFQWELLAWDLGPCLPALSPSNALAPRERGLLGVSRMPRAHPWPRSSLSP